MYGLPDSFKIGTLTYELRWDKACAPSGYRGIHSGDTLLIMIDPQLPEEQARITVMHECVHAVHKFMGLDDDDKEERYTECTATGLCLMARDNPLLWRWLQGQKIE